MEVTRCMHCGKRTVPVPGFTGRTELICVSCGVPKIDSADPLIDETTQKWGCEPTGETNPIGYTR